MNLSVRTSAWLAALTCALLAVPALAQQAPAPVDERAITAAFENADEITRTRDLIMLAKTGNHELAARLLAAYPLTGPHSANRVLFIEGLILRGRGDLKGAVGKYRDALGADPKLTLVRSELAETLTEMGEDDSAKHHLELLAADAPTDAAAAGIRSFIDQIDARRPWLFSAYASLAPSTNINGGSNHKTVYSPVFGADLDIDKGGRKKSGVGGAVGASGAYTHKFNDSFMMVAAGQAEARLYTDPDFNAYSFSQSLELRHIVDAGYIGVGAVASQSLESDGWGLSYMSYGPRVSLRLNAGARDVMTSSVTHEWRDAQNGVAFDSTALMIDAAWTHAFDSSLNVTLSTGFDNVVFKNSANSYHSWSAGMNIYKELPFGITADVTGHINYADYDDYNFIAGKYRNDIRTIGSLALTKRDFDIFGFAPALSYTYTHNFSNIAIYDYDNHAVDFRLTKDF